MLPVENGPCFIQVGGVQGLAQNRMFPFTACAALMNGISFSMSRSIEKLASCVVGPAGDLVVGVAIHRVVAGPDRDPPEGEPRPVRAIEQIDGHVAIGLAEHGQIAPAQLVEGAAESFPDLRRAPRRRPSRRPSPLGTSVSCPPVLPVGAGPGGDQRRRAARRADGTAGASVGRDAGAVAQRPGLALAGAGLADLSRRAGNAAAAAVQRIGGDIETVQPAGRLTGGADRPGTPLVLPAARERSERRARGPSADVETFTRGKRLSRDVLDGDCLPAMCVGVSGEGRSPPAKSPMGTSVPDELPAPPTLHAQPLLPEVPPDEPPDPVRRSPTTVRSRSPPEPPYRCRCRAGARAAGAEPARASAGVPVPPVPGSRAASAGRPVPPVPPSRCRRCPWCRRSPVVPVPPVPAVPPAPPVPLEPPVPAPLPPVPVLLDAGWKRSQLRRAAPPKTA